MQFEWLELEDKRWRDILQSTKHDFYHLPEYSMATVPASEGRVGAAVVSSDECSLFLPLILKEIETNDGRLVDAQSPYGYPAPLLIGDSKGDVHTLLGYLVDQLRHIGVVSLFVRLSPLMGLQPSDLGGLGTVVQHGETLSIDLTLSVEDMWSHTRRDHRTQINKSLRLGHVAWMDEEWSHFDGFIDMYHDNMRRVNATSSYMFPREHFYRLKELLPSNLHLCVVEIDGELASSALFSEVNGVVEAYLSASDDRFQKLAPKKLLIHFVRQWAKERGNTIYHLGGGVGAQKDSLHKFKAGFATHHHEFFTWRVIVNDEAYQGLVANWTDESGRVPGGIEGFFPPYRLPIS